MRRERAIEARAVAQHAVDELGREPAIAIVEAGTCELAIDRRRRPGAITLDTLEDPACELARRHAPPLFGVSGGLVSLSPTATPRPAASSFAVIRLRPAIWSSRTATTPPMHEM